LSFGSRLTRQPACPFSRDSGCINFATWWRGWTGWIAADRPSRSRRAAVLGMTSYVRRIALTSPCHTVGPRCPHGSKLLADGELRAVVRRAGREGAKIVWVVTNIYKSVTGEYLWRLWPPAGGEGVVYSGPCRERVCDAFGVVLGPRRRFVDGGSRSMQDSNRATLVSQSVRTTAVGVAARLIFDLWQSGSCVIWKLAIWLRVADSRAAWPLR
jgi:hypothetical protein